MQPMAPMRRFLPLALIAAVLPAAAQDAPAISADTLREVTQTLASDAYEGRAPGTPGEEKTLAFVIERFKAAGLQPGNGESWLQPVPMVELTAENVAPLGFTGGTAPVALEYRTDMVIGTTRAVPEIALKDGELVFVGFGIDAPERGWNDYDGVDVTGKTVLILVNDPDWMTDSSEGPFGGKAMSYYGRWTYKLEEAARHGAAAALLIHDMFAAGYDWGVVRSSMTGPQLTLDGAEGPHMLAQGWIENQAAQRLFAAAGKDLYVLGAAAMQPGFRAVPLGMKANIAFTNSVRKVTSHNVVGVLPGSERPGETVLYMAHWDHLGRCDAIEGDDICNGAVDNAAGVAGLVALAEAQGKSGAAKRSIVFLATTGEEAGLLGSEYYARYPLYPLATTAGGVNMDTMNVWGRASDFIAAGDTQNELAAMAAPFVAAQGRTMAPDPGAGGGSYFRSDHFSLARAGVPMLYPVLPSSMWEGGEQAAREKLFDYTLRRYHKPSDEYDPAWDWAGAVEDLQVYYRLGRTLADGTMWPRWLPGSEFRAAREASRAGQ